MRIYGPNGTASAAPSRPARRTASTAFEVAGEPQAQAPAAPPALRTIGGIDALMALQGEEQSQADRRRRAIQRGRGALDALDALKLALLSGAPEPSALARLRSAAAELILGSGDPGLDAVLGEIELRVAVELAKFGAAQAAQNPGK
jgi:hypothetical protein